ncbi:MAG: PAS domain S-box protein [Nitrospira sp.]|nr:PAS domain S-box protein [bacterium]MBL7049817.1 PAS domain S-box protein [Nitrospira sp.]
MNDAKKTKQQLIEELEQYRQKIEDLSKQQTLEASLLAAEKKYRLNLEQIVRERTAELTKKTSQLRKEIIERKKAEAVIAYERDEWQQTFDTIPDSVMIIDKDNKVLKANAAVRNKLGLTGKQIAGQPCYKIFHGTDTQPEYCPHSKTLKDHSTHVVDVYEPKLNGHYIVSTSPLFDMGGNFTGVIEISHDITKRKKYETALKNNEKRLEEAQELAGLGSWEWDIANNSLAWSDETYTIFGLKRETFNVTYEAYIEHIHPEDSEAVKEAIQKALYEKQPFNIDHKIIHINGTIKTVHEQGEVFYSEEGKPLRMIGTVLDITERKEIENELRQFNRKQLAIGQLGAMALSDAPLDLLFNQAIELSSHILEAELCKILKLSSDAKSLLFISGIGWNKGLVGKATIDAGRNSQAGYTLLSKRPVIVDNLLLEKRFSGPQLLHDHNVISGLSVVIRTKDLPYGVMGIHTSKLRKFTESDGHFLNSVANILGQAIERDSAEKALRENEEKFKALSDNSINAISVMDGKGMITYWNEAAKTALGYSAEDTIGQNLHDILVSEQAKNSYIKNLPEFAESGTCTMVGKILETYATHKNGTRIPVEVSVSVYRLNDDWYSIGTFRDISQRKDSEIKMANYLKQLEKSNDELNDFAYIIAHDLKEPLRAINSLTNWIVTDLEDHISAEGKENINLLTSRVKRMNDLVEGILQYSRAGKITGTITETDIKTLVAEVTDLLSPPKNMQISITGNLPVIQCEHSSIMQIFQNLIGNALKYMDKTTGLIQVSAKDEDTHWEFCISDNGPGIKEEDQTRVFQMFRVLQPRDKVEATGVGLAIVKKIVKMYDGNVWVESEPGNGSSFYFTISKNP